MLGERWIGIAICVCLLLLAGPRAPGQDRPDEAKEKPADSKKAAQPAGQGAQGGSMASDAASADEKGVRDEVSGDWKPWTLGQFYRALKNPRGYQGGRGLISAQGMSGMFLNPTSGTLAQGQLTVQYCVLVFQQPAGANAGHGILASYGVDDFFEVGGFVNFIDLRGSTHTPVIGGPQARLRFLKDEEWWPELSLGGIYLDGDAEDDRFARGEIVLAASKYFQLQKDGFFRSTRIHLGLRQVERHENPAGVDPNATLGYIGGDLEFPLSLHLVSEVGTKDGISTGPEEHTPWSIGGQWRPNNVVGLSVAAVQNGSMDKIGLYVGIGLTLGF